MPNRETKRKVAPNIAQRPRGATPKRRPNTLPSQYNFTPTVQDPPPPLQTPEIQVANLQRQSSAAQIQNYPPPQQLFQNSFTHPPPPELHRTPSEEVNFNPQIHVGLQDDPPPSLVRPSQTRSHPSHPLSQGNNFEDSSSPVLPELQEDLLRALNALILVPNRDKFTTVLSPAPIPNTQWYDFSSSHVL
ncbi:PREDICTED: leucine-rich repeat extensin-like protein 2 [Camelina sativa]|uniref:Leucine-rich repeat extensin-like protein 2 n=1 Tax=Camelina sativa TaxID=90675 RepID=A0ABM0VYY7_CAMSA|nr:PREDICTED: leucine-rich repeat extensin-like protein 2 [Camelina sativa]